MKLLLIRPPYAIEKFYFPRFINEPLGIETLAAFLSADHEVRILDAVAEGWNQYWHHPHYADLIFQGLTTNHLQQKISSHAPDVIGISCLFATQNDSTDLTIETIRAFSKTVPIIIGGPHPSASPAETLKEKQDADIVVYGEGEITVKELLDHRLKNLDQIQGIAYRNNGRITVNDPRPMIADLDRIPIPLRQHGLHKNYSKQFLYQSVYFRIKKLSLPYNVKMALTSHISSLPFFDRLFYTLYNKKNQKHLPVADIVTSRGCPNRCAFCAVHNIWGHGWRKRSAANVLQEIDLLVKKFGVRQINIQDDNFNVSKKRTIEICRGIVENNYNITLLPNSGSFVPALDEEVLSWLKKAGVHCLRMSIESGNQYILSNVIKKRIDLKTVKPIVDICRKLGIRTEGAFMFGVPGETVATMRETLDYAKKTGFDRIITFIFQPFPNTELYKICKQNNYLTSDYDPSKTYITGNNCFVKTDSFGPEDVIRIVGR